jgi:hypothetical protein
MEIAERGEKPRENLFNYKYSKFIEGVESLRDDYLREFYEFIFSGKSVNGIITENDVFFKGVCERCEYNFDELYLDEDLLIDDFFELFLLINAGISFFNKKIKFEDLLIIRIKLMEIENKASPYDRDLSDFWFSYILRSSEAESENNGALFQAILEYFILEMQKKAPEYYAYLLSRTK